MIGIKGKMPYIKGHVRSYLLPEYETYPNGPGELNYQITEIIKDYATKNPGYQGINDILGALEGAKLEFYRRVAAPYEDTKIKENGDVY